MGSFQRLPKVLELLVNEEVRGEEAPSIMNKVLFGVFVALFLFSAIGAAQSVIVTSGGQVVTVHAGDSKCVFQGPVVIDSETITCFRGTTEVLFVKLRPGLSHLLTGSYDFPLHVVGWTLSQPTQGTFTWQVSVDGATVGAGTF